MMTIDKCCEIGLGVLDGKYGWMAEFLLLVGIVLFFNIFVKAFLRRLHLRFAREQLYWHDSFVRALYKPLSYYVWFLAITNAMDLVNLRLVGDNFFEIPTMHFMLRTAAVIGLGWFLLRWKDNVVEYLVTRSKAHHEPAMEQGRLDMMGKIVTLVIVIMVSLLLLETTGKSFTTLLAFGGVGGLAIAFASQEMIANFFGGLMIYVTKPFAIGDWILLTERNLEGHVEEIGWYMTRIRTFEKRPIYVPNSIFSKTIVMTPSRMTHRQFKETISIRYEDLPLLKPIIADIREMLKDHEEVDNDNRFLVNLTRFGTYSIDILIDAYTLSLDTEDYINTKADILFRIAEILAKHGAEMPYPISVVYETPKPK